MFSTAFNGSVRNRTYGYRSRIIKGKVNYPPYFNVCYMDSVLRWWQNK